MTQTDSTPDWFTEEATRAANQAEAGTAVNNSAAGGPKQNVRRINKAFQVEEGRAAKWHLLVATEKGKGRGHKRAGRLRHTG